MINVLDEYKKLKELKTNPSIIFYSNKFKPQPEYLNIVGQMDPEDTKFQVHCANSETCGCPCK
jgi:hypothetical protein